MIFEEELSELKSELQNHPLYQSINSIEDIKYFMESHVFAVWDFMSLLKKLQVDLTNTNVPWTPVKNSNTARFINEIVLGEESDFNEKGEIKSHFEMYLDAMEEVGANTEEIHIFLDDVKNGKTPQNAISERNVNDAVKDFLTYTFEVIDNGQIHEIASAFTFGREDVIPDMFIAILEKVDPINEKYSKLRYYLDRHIELDGDEHGPMSLKMMEELCQNDQKKIDEVINTAQKALNARNNLWLSIYFGSANRQKVDREVVFV